MGRGQVLQRLLGGLRGTTVEAQPTLLPDPSRAARKPFGAGGGEGAKKQVRKPHTCPYAAHSSEEWAQGSCCRDAKNVPPRKHGAKCEKM